jgi:CBS domain-containing protein
MGLWLAHAWAFSHSADLICGIDMSTGGFATRLAHLRALLATDAAETGDQALKMLEEYLEQAAYDAGYQQGPGSIGRYASFLRNRGQIRVELLERAELYAQVRNCLAHTYGLQTSPALAEELITYLAELMHQEAATAGQMMSTNLRTISEHAPLREARDLMLREGFSRLPVLQNKQICVGLLTDRDLVAAEAQAEGKNGLIDGVTVASAIGSHSKKRVVIIAPDAPYKVVVDALQKRGVEALLVTKGGQRNQPPIGIITHADILYRM